MAAPFAFKKYFLRFIWNCKLSAAFLHHNYIIMPRVSGTFKQSVKGITDAYAYKNGISFSEAMEILTASSGLEWWEKLSKSEKTLLNKKFNVFKPIK